MNNTAQYYTADELVERWKGAVTKGTLANWRAAKNRRGPPFTKIGGRVLYPMAGVVKWESDNLHAANDNDDSK